MWLINTDDLTLKSFHQSPAYAVLSHTWSTDDNDELNFDEFRAGQGRQKIGFRKIQMCCDQAKKDGLAWAWVDTCCIDKRNNTELSEAINSMFKWYQEAQICYVYLADVHSQRPLDLAHRDDFEKFKASRWFTRGWTLQEIIAPEKVTFYDQIWNKLGTKTHLAKHIQAITGITAEVLRSSKSFRDCSIAQRMSWASRRRTTRIEDIAYCLIGLFDVNMPMLYGEGSKAFIRLQEEIIQQTDDETIFIWNGVSNEGDGLLAPSPSHFIDSATIRSRRYYEYGHEPHSMTPRGLSMQCRLLPWQMNTYLAMMQCVQEMPDLTTEQVGIFLCRTSDDLQYQRVMFKGDCWVGLASLATSKATTSRVFVRDRGDTLRLRPCDGLPRVIVRSNLHAWHFPAYDFGKLSGGLFTRLTETQLIAACRMAFAFRCDPSAPWTIPSQHVSDSNTVPLKYEGLRSYLRHPYKWSPRKVQQIQFLPQDLERGVVIAFTRLADPATTFHYHLEVGFDKDFRPVCILHAEQFQLVPLHRWRMFRKLRDRSPTMLLRVLVGLFFMASLPLWPGTLPDVLSIFEAFWPSSNCQCERQKDGAATVTKELCHICYAGLNNGPRPCIQKLRKFWNPTQRARKQKDSFMRRIEGDRIAGFKFSTADDMSLLFSNHCADLELSFEPLGQMDWQLTFRETPRHSPKWQYRGFCFECLWGTMDIAFSYSVTAIFVLSLPFFLIGSICQEKGSRALGLDRGNCYVMVSLVFYSPWYWISAYLLVVALQRWRYDYSNLYKKSFIFAGFCGALPTATSGPISWFSGIVVALPFICLGIIAHEEGGFIIDDV